MAEIFPEMVYFPNAKINIGLNIIDKRSDGYHNIASVFYPIPYREALEIWPSEKFSFETTGLSIEGQLENNLVYKAYRALQNEGLIRGKSAGLHLHKVIPMGAGIGGGSADAAFALIGLNEVLELGLSNKELEQLAAKLGSDCPFFIENRARYCFDRGSSFEDIDFSLEGVHLVLIYPNLHISTAQAYAGVQASHPKFDLRDLLKEPRDEWKQWVKNDFEEGLFKVFPILETIKSDLYQMGAFYASMTGSGSTVYGLFDNEVHIPLHFKEYTVFTGELS